MSSQIQVHKEALTDLRVALLTFRGKASEQLSALDLRLRHDLALFGQVVERAQLELRQCQEHLRQVGQAGRQGDEWALREAKQRLYKAEERLSLARNSMRELEQAIQTYARHARRFYQHLEHEVPRAAAVLDRKVAALDLYESLAAARVMSVPNAAEAPVPDATDTNTMVSHLLAHISWAHPRYWGTILEITMLGMAAMVWLNQLPPLDVQDFPEYYQQLVESQSPEEVPSPYQQLNDQQGIQDQQRKEAQAQSRTGETAASAGADPL